MKNKKTISSLFKREILTQVQDDVLLPQALKDLADLRTDGVKRVRIARKLSELQQGCKSETFRAWSKSKTTSYRPNALTSSKRAAFTLAELLITLAIISIVAAMTIPTLISNIEDKRYNTASQVFEKKLTDGLRLMNANQVLAGYATTEMFLAELGKHVKILKVCNPNELEKCFNKDFQTSIWDLDSESSYDISTMQVTDFNTSQDLKQSTLAQTNVLGVVFGDGVSAILSYNNTDCKEDPYSNQFTGTECISMIYDTNGYGNPNIMGKDIRNINNNFDAGIKFGGKYWTYPRPANVALSKSECAELLGEDNCPSSVDYWAGAIKACGGIDKMASPDDLNNLARKIYATSSRQENITKLFKNARPAARYDIFANKVASESNTYTNWKLNVFSHCYMEQRLCSPQEYTCSRNDRNLLFICQY